MCNLNNFFNFKDEVMRNKTIEKFYKKFFVLPQNLLIKITYNKKFLECFYFIFSLILLVLRDKRQT